MLAKIAFLAMILTSQMSQAQPKPDRPRNFVEVPVYVEKSYGKYDSRDNEELQTLRARVKVLEAATRQLQEEIYSIKYLHAGKPTANGGKNAGWFCALKSSFDRSYSGRGRTQLESRVNALNSCRKDDGIHCREEKVECEKEFA